VKHTGARMNAACCEARFSDDAVEVSALDRACNLGSMVPEPVDERTEAIGDTGRERFGRRLM
jgi:hypothetical protein